MYSEKISPEHRRHHSVDPHTEYFGRTPQWAYEEAERISQMSVFMQMIHGPILILRTSIDVLVGGERARFIERQLAERQRGTSVDAYTDTEQDKINDRLDKFKNLTKDGLLFSHNNCPSVRLKTSRKPLSYTCGETICLDPGHGLALTL